ncbi:MAG: patatin-like phospholipase family protein [Pseudomonadota bacterium]
MSERIFTGLTIDGGGVRGIISARLLQEVEERTGKPICELFDLIAGASTGAILAGALAAPSKEDPSKPRYTAKEMVTFYQEYSHVIFPEDRFRQWKHFVPAMNGFFDPEPFERLLEDKLENLTLRDSLTHLMMAGADMKKFTPVWMSYFHEKDKHKDKYQKWENLKIRDAIRASASPPLVFPAKYIYTQPNKNMPEAADRHAFLDGSLFASTLPRRAHSKAKQMAPQNARIVMLSVGTGSLEQSLTPDAMNKMTPFDWLRTVTFSASTELTLQDLLNDLYEEIGNDLCRLDVVIDGQADDAPTTGLFDARKENMDKLLKLAEDLISEKDQEIDRICTLLLAKHQQDLNLEHSRDALSHLYEKLNNVSSVRDLNQLYTKIVQYSADIKDQSPAAKDIEVYELCQEVSPEHFPQLKEFYHARHNQLSHLEANPKKQKGIARFFNFSCLRRGSNDNKKPAATQKPDTPPAEPKQAQKGPRRQP